MFALVVLFPRHPGMATLGDRIQCERDLCSDPMQLVLGNAGLSVGPSRYWLYRYKLTCAEEMLCPRNSV